MALARDSVSAFVALGANLGDAMVAVQQAAQALAGIPGTQLLACSSWYRSAPVLASGPDFVNGVAQISTQLSAPELLQQLQLLEQGAGRLRPYPNAPRTLDLDLLLYGLAQMDSPALTLPHPRMWQRAFVLLPLSELAPDRVTAAQLAAVRTQVIERVV